MLETRLLNKGLNTDLAKEFTPNGQYPYSINHDLMNSGKLKATLGNTEVVTMDMPLPSGQNKIIGSEEYRKENSAYCFLWNEFGEHRIFRYNRTSNSIDTILIEQNPPVLNFDTDFLITSIDIVPLTDEDNLLSWVSPVPNKINIRRAYAFTHGIRFTDNLVSGGKVGFISATPISLAIGEKVRIKQDNPTYPTYNGYATIIAKPQPNIVVIDKNFLGNTPPEPGYIYPDYSYTQVTQQIVDAIKWQPPNSPSCFLDTDTSYLGNNIRNKFFQLATRYIYDDFEKSCHGPYSKVMIPPGLGTVDPNAYVNYENKYNYIRVTFDTGENNVKKIELLARTKTSDLGVEVYNDTYVVKSFDKQELGLQDNTTYAYNFYNDTAPAALSLSEQNQLFDNVPLESGCQVVSEDMRMLYADNTERFDLVKPNVNISFYTKPVDTSQVPSILTTAPSLGGLRFKLPTTPVSEGGVITIKTTLGDTINYTFTSSDTQNYPNNLRASIQGVLWDYGYLTGQIISNTTSQSYYRATYYLSYTIFQAYPSQTGFTPGITTYFSAPAPFEMFVIAIDFTANIVGIGTNILLSAQINYPNADATNTVQCYKKGALHPIGIVYYDKAGRCSSVIDCGFAKIPFFNGPNNSNPAHINLDIKHIPPDWAVRYQIVVVKNKSYRKFTQCTITKFLQRATEAIMTLGGMPDAETYTYTPGDRVRFIQKDNTQGASYNDYVDLGVLFYNESLRELTIESPISTPIVGQIIVGTLIEIYTPNPVSSPDIYWEIVKEFDIINPGSTSRFHEGQYQNQTATLPAKIDLDGGDVFYRQRIQDVQGTTAVYWIETSNATDFLPSAVTDNGRPHLIMPDFKRVRLINNIRFSERFIINSYINGLSAFNDGNLYDGCAIKYGAIKRMLNKERFIRVFQEYKVGTIPVNQSIQQTSTGAVTIQNNTPLNPIDYFQGDFGIADNGESLATFGFADYFTDLNRGAICRVSNNGVVPISMMYGINTEITNQFTTIRNNFVRTNMYGSFDRNEAKGYYILCVEEKFKLPLPGTLYPGFTLAFKESDNCFVGYFSYQPENICSVGNDIIVFKDGKTYLQNSNVLSGNFFGIQYPKIVDVTFNDQFTVEKNQKAIVEQSSDIYELVSIDNDRGQDTSLITSDFEQLGTGYCAALWKDSNTPNVTDPLLNGDEIKGFVMKGRFQYSGTNQSEITDIGLEQIPVLRSGF